MDWIMYTAGIVAHIWAPLTIVGLISLLNRTDVKRGFTTVRINGGFYIPWIGILAFWMWYFFG